MIDVFFQKWMKEAARQKNLVVLDSRSASQGKADLRKIFSDRYFELDPKSSIVIDEAKGFFLAQKSPVILIEAEALEGSLKSLMGEALNLKIIGFGDKKVVNLVREIPGWKVEVPQNEYELTQIISKIDSHFGPLYMHVI